MRRCLFFCVALTAFCLCAPAQKIRVKADKSLDAAKYPTYAWATQVESMPENSLVSDPRTFEGRLKAAVDEILKEKGLSLAPPGQTPSMWLTYHVSVEVKSSTQGLYPSSAASNTKFEQVWVVSQMEGTLTIDLNDAASGNLLWQVTAVSAIKPVINDKKLNAALEKMFKSLPWRG